MHIQAHSRAKDDGIDAIVPSLPFAFRAKQGEAFIPIEGAWYSAEWGRMENGDLASSDAEEEGGDGKASVLNRFSGSSDVGSESSGGWETVSSEDER